MKLNEKIGTGAKQHLNWRWRSWPPP